MAEALFWADQIARKIIKNRGDKEKYVIAAGITPSGTIHIGNFREIITVDLIARALTSAGRKVRYIYSWDDYDRLRKIPKNMPKPEVLKKFIGQPVVDTPDTFGCHKSYAEHLEKELEDSLPPVGIKPEFIYQSKMYRAGVYADEIRLCMLSKDKIRTILDKFRKDPLPKTWYPLKIFCRKCKKDNAWATKYDNEYTVEYRCECGHAGSTNFKEEGIVKLAWRVDWPMRWHYEGVDCEGGGKDHSAPGGSLDTGHEIQKAVYSEEPPVRFMYDWVIIKGAGGKMSSSTGNVLSLKDCLEIYLPEIVRFLFAGTKPVKEFAIPTDEEILKVYEDFYRTERIYYGKEDSPREAHWKRVYEMSCPCKPAKRMLVQPTFRKCIELIHMHRKPEDALRHAAERMSRADRKRYLAVLTCARNWIDKYAPEEQKISVQESVPRDIRLSASQKRALREFGKIIERAHSEEDMIAACRELAKKHGMSTGDFFKAAYLVLIKKERGPRLVPFIISIGGKRVAKLFKSV